MKQLFKVQGVRGTAKVVCFSPKHNLTMAQMSSQEILLIIKTWIKETVGLRHNETVQYVQIFENKGAVMGCSNPHPHGQIWATEVIPQEPANEIAAQQKYRDDHGSCLLCDVVNVEVEVKDRIVTENDSWMVIVPFWAVWPYETLVLPKSHVSAIDVLSEKQQVDLSEILRIITCKYDNMFETSFPYSMGLHGAPVNDDPSDHPMHLHLHFYPPLLRSATVKKFLVG
jgi:UDPglucose--hexose-1-phosphate uridylyltransferase